MKKFEQPYLVGVIGKRLGYLKLQRRFDSIFRRKKLPFVYLPFKVEPKYLKNLIMCMRLMDVVGINVGDRYQKSVIPYLDLIDESARKIKRVNIIVKKGNKFVGYYSRDLVNVSIKLWSNLTPPR